MASNQTAAGELALLAALGLRTGALVDDAARAAAGSPGVLRVSPQVIHVIVGPAADQYVAALNSAAVATE